MNLGSWAAGALLLSTARATRGVRSLRRPASATTPEFDLSYVRTGQGAARGRGRGGADRIPAVVIPGGPGLGSILPYRSMRAIAARGGLDLIMVEHRGIGLSRRDRLGRDLPPDAMRVTEVVDDIAAVLDHEGIAQAHIVGSSYGSYLASAFGARHPTRVASMLLDSALQAADAIELERELVRDTFGDRGTPTGAAIGALIDAGTDQRILLDVVRAAHELGGEPLLRALLRPQLRGKRGLGWRAAEAYASREASTAPVPGIYEFDIAGAIGFRELNYGAMPDGLPLDPALTYSPLAPFFPPFEGEDFDLHEAVRAFTWPMVLLIGERDLRTPPTIAERVAASVPGAVTLRIDNGHSALDTHPVALLNVLRLLADGRQADLPALAERISALPRRGPGALLPTVLGSLARLDSLCAQGRQAPTQTSSRRPPTALA